MGFTLRYRSSDCGSRSVTDVRTCFASGFPVRLDCVRRANAATPASFALIQSLNQFLNQRTQLRGVTFICHRSTKFAPVPLHAVSHIHLRYSGANACECCGSRKHVWCHDLKWLCCLWFTTQCV